MAITMFKSKKVYRAYQDVFDLESPQVQTVLNDLCKAHSVFDGGFDRDPYVNAFASGERNVILRILTILKTNPQDIVDLGGIIND